MGDFLLDLRPPGDRAPAQSAGFLRFYPDMQVHKFELPEFSLVLTSADVPGIWGPFAPADGTMLVALCGRIALEQKQWDDAARIQGDGGLACKFISQVYVKGGISALESLNGNFVILLLDRAERKLFLVTDRWGLVPAFRHGGAAGFVYSSHPDALADAVGQNRNWDSTSLAEFVLTGKVSAPYTYYEKIRALPQASRTELHFAQKPASETIISYFQPAFEPEPGGKPAELVEQFANAFRQAVAKRTLPSLGRTAIALSGGLDSRAILCAAAPSSHLVSFCSYDEENDEFRLARRIAQQTGVEFIPFRRPFDYYAENAELGAKISAGMGCIASNHFLGFRSQLRQLGISNLLTGCYCDYVFKGLALNTRSNPWTTRQSLAPVAHEYYGFHFRSGTRLGGSVQKRLDELLSPDPSLNGTTLLDLERRRIFPLAYEADNAERTIPQRVMGWYVPIAENDLLDVYARMSLEMKLNRALFVPMVQKVCGELVCNIPDANTGAAVGASPLVEALTCHLRTAKKAVRKLRRTMATVESWPNWSHYVRHSEKIRSQWQRPNPAAHDLFLEILGPNQFKQDIAAYQGRDLYIFLQLYTLKLWLDQRA